MAQTEWDIKVAQIRRFMAENDYSAALLASRAGFGWLTGGGHSYVNSAVEAGVAVLAVTADAVVLLCSNIEAPRFREEEIGGYEAHAEAQEGQRRLDEDDDGHVERGNDDDLVREVRQYLAEDDAGVRGAGRERGQDKFLVAKLLRERAHDNRVAIPREQAEDEDQHEDRAA